MYISTKDWQAFVRKLSAVNKQAGDAVRNYVLKNGFGDTDALIDYCYLIAEQYGTASASLAALMYDTVSELEGNFYPAAEMASNPGYGDVAKAVQGTMKTSRNPDEIAGAVSRLVKMTGQDTLLQNALRDEAEFAWIPVGDTCPFCLMLASNGWQRMSRKALRGGHAEHIHANCDCTYMIRHSSDFNVRGYDPDAFLKRFGKPKNTTWSQSQWDEAIRKMRKKDYAENKEIINAQKRSAYEKRKELNSSAAEESEA